MLYSSQTSPMIAPMVIRERVIVSNGRRDTQAATSIARYRYAKFGVQRTTSQVDENLWPCRTLLYGQWSSASLLNRARSYTRRRCTGSMVRPGRTDHRRNRWLAGTPLSCKGHTPLV